MKRQQLPHTIEPLEKRHLLSTMLHVDVGSSSNFTDSHGQVWVKDTGFSGGTVSTNSVAINNTTDDALYYTRRWGNMSYTLPADNGAYTLRLYFTEPVMTAANKRKFNVFAEGTQVLSNLDLFAASGARDPLTKSFNINIADNKLDLKFVDLIDHAILSAIELVPRDVTPPAQPANFFATPAITGITVNWTANTESDLAGYTLLRGSTAAGPFTKIASPTASATQYFDAAAAPNAPSFYQLIANDISNNSSAPATANATRSADASIRINTGGPAQVVNGVSWYAGDGESGPWGQVIGGFAYKAPGSPAIDGVTAPADTAVYQTEWTGGTSNGGTPGSTAFTYRFAVGNGDWLVKLHFDELNKKGAGLRVFDVDLNGNRVLDHFDVFAASGGIDKAIIEPFPVHITDNVVSIAFITEVENAKISGIELIPQGTVDAAPSLANIAWTTDPAAEPVARYESIDVQVGSKLFIMGGFKSFNLDVTNRVDIYDLSNKTWSQGADLPGAQTHAAAATDGTYIYVAAGQYGPGDTSGTATNEVWKYDITNNMWSPFVALPDVRFGGALKLVGSVLHYFGGDIADRVTVSPLHWGLDLSNPDPQWKALAPLPMSGDHLSSAVVNGKIYAIGGEHDHGTLYLPHNFVYEYDSATDSWTRKADLPVARSHAEGTTLVINNKLFITGGQAANISITADTEEYDPVLDLWRKVAPLPIVRKGSSAAFYNNQIFVTGGQSYTAVVGNSFVGTVTGS